MTDMAAQALEAARDAYVDLQDWRVSFGLERYDDTLDALHAAGLHLVYEPLPEVQIRPKPRPVSAAVFARLFNVPLWAIYPNDTKLHAAYDRRRRARRRRR